ncbi:FAD-dependent monooxygenase [Xylella taiwanensis]
MTPTATHATSAVPRSMAKVNTPDVLVIDAGPAGYTAAILLTQRGWGVTWLEKISTRACTSARRCCH